MPKSWVNAEQKAWLDSNVADFLEAQLAGRTDRYLTGLNERWFKRYPELKHTCPPSDGTPQELSSSEQLALTKAIVACKKQIKAWMFWETGKKKRSTNAKLDLLVFDLSAHGTGVQKRNRAPQAVEIYQRMFADIVGPKVRDAIEEAGADTRGTKMSIRRQISEASLKAEDPSVHAAIAREICRIKSETELNPDPSEDQPKIANLDSESSKTSPLAYHKAINKLPDFLKQSLGAASAATGWSIFVAAAGPNPAANGAIYMEHYYFGPKSSADQDFMDAHEGFDEGFRKPFGKFVKNVFPPEIRLQRALISTPKSKPIDQPGADTHVASHANESSALDEPINLHQITPMTRSSTPDLLIESLSPLPVHHVTSVVQPESQPGSLHESPVVPPCASSPLKGPETTVSPSPDPPGSSPTSYPYPDAPNGPTSPISNAIHRMNQANNANNIHPLPNDCGVNVAPKPFSNRVIDPDLLLRPLGHPSPLSGVLEPVVPDAASNATPITLMAPALTVDYQIAGAVIKAPLVHLPPEQGPPKLTPAQKRAATIAAKKAKSLAEENTASRKRKEPDSVGDDSLAERRTRRVISAPQPPDASPSGKRKTTAASRARASKDKT